MELLIAFGFVLLAGFFAGSETAFISIDRMKLHSNLHKPDKRYKVLEWMMKRPEDMVGAFLVGTNICIVASTLLVTGFLTRALTSQILVPVVTTLVMTPVILLCSDVFPKLIFRKFADKLMHNFAFVYIFFFVFLFPMQFLFVRTIQFILHIIGVRKKKKGMVSKDEFRFMLDISASKGAIKQKEKEFIESIMNFKNVTVREIMVPLIRMSLVEENDTIARAGSIMLSTKHSRLPVYKNRVDNIVGYIENKDIIDAMKDEPVSKYLRESNFIPECVAVDRVLLEMQSSGNQMIFTIDEYGGVSGVVTSQDLVAEVIGEFVDLADRSISRDKDTCIVDGRMDIDELDEELNLDIEKNGFETVGGFVMYSLKRLPKEGDNFEFGRYSIEVISMNHFEVEKVKIVPKKKFHNIKKNKAVEKKSD